MNLIRFKPIQLTNPCDRLSAFQREVNRLFDAPTVGWRDGGASWAPPLDVSENENEFSVTLEAPGLTREAFELSLDGDTLTVSGERKSSETAEGETVLRRERFQGSFARTLNLPAGVDGEKVSAAYENGVLTVKLPKLASAKPRRIEIV